MGTKADRGGFYCNRDNAFNVLNSKSHWVYLDTLSEHTHCGLVLCVYCIRLIHEDDIAAFK